MIGAQVAGALPELRRAAEALMLDAGRALRPGPMGYDPVTQVEGPTEVELFTSDCKIQTRNTEVSEAQVGERTAVQLRLELHLPIGTEPLQAGDEFEVTTPGPLSAVPAGRRYRVAGPFEKSLATARRYTVEEVVT